MIQETFQRTANEAVIRRIQKLLQAAQYAGDGTISQEEASLAMARANELMLKHNLEMAMVQATHVAGGTVSAPEEKREKTRISRSAQYRWQRELWKTIAEVNFCWHSVIRVYEGKRGTKSTTSRVPVKRHMLLGRESNVTVARMMGEYIEDTMERLVTVEGGFTNQERLSRSAISWKSGCAERIAERLMERFQMMQSPATNAPDTGCTSIALRDVVAMEYEANYDARYGRVGAYKQNLIQEAEWQERQAERQAKAEADRIQAEKDWAAYLLTESPAEKKKREKKEQKERIANARYWERQDRKYENQQWREASKVDSEAVERGRRAGNKVGLDTQVPETARTTAERRLR